MRGICTLKRALPVLGNGALLGAPTLIGKNAPEVCVPSTEEHRARNTLHRAPAFIVTHWERRLQPASHSLSLRERGRVRGNLHAEACAPPVWKHLMQNAPPGAPAFASKNAHQRVCAPGTICRGEAVLRPMGDPASCSYRCKNPLSLWEKVRVRIIPAEVCVCSKLGTPTLVGKTMQMGEQISGLPWTTRRIILPTTMQLEAALSLAGTTLCEMLYWEHRL